MSIKQAMTRFGAVLGVALLLLGIVSVVELQTVKRVEQETEVALAAVRAVTLMDMHHEGIEGTVYHYLVAMLEGDVQEQGSVRDALTQTIDDMQGLYQQLMDLPLSEQERQALGALKGDLNHYYQTARRQVQAENQVAYQQGVDAFKEAFDTLENSLDQAGKSIEQAAKAQLEESAGSIALAEWVIILGILGVIGLAGWNLWRLWTFLNGQLGGEVAEVTAIAREITEGKLDSELDEARPGLYADLRTMQQKLRVQFEEVSRLRQALETVTTNVMVADEHFNIVYLNPAVTRMFKVAEEDIRTVFPDFRADDLLGKSIDLFHKNPAHQRAVLEKLQGTHKARITIGGRHFDLTAAPVIGPGGQRLGSVVEWADITDQLKVEQEIQSLVDHASKGNLDTRLALEGKEGFALNLSQGLNTILDRMQAVFNDVQRTAESLAQGDLTTSIEEAYEGQYGAIANALNNAVDKLHHAMASIVTSTQNIRQSMQEIASGNSQLSERTEKQSSNLEETASSMEELASNVRNTAANAREANELAQTTRQKAEVGGEVVQRTIASMEEINVASNKIAEIIDVIDDIAFQTNLLALNASVEAARAGEQGRGFAVVATEVRNLAQRSATSAKEIKELIEDSVRKVDAGGKLVNESGETLAEIIANVKKVSDFISDIAGATEEQSSGIEQVNRAVVELDEITQQNAALAEEIASASESAIESAEGMAHQVAFFKVEGAVAATGGAPRSEPPVPSQSAPAASEQVVSPVKPDSPPAEDDEWEEF